MTRRRWACPRCGLGISAPSRPRRDDVRRYCLPCSKETGKLVERVCPANERRREVKKKRAAERAAEARAKTRAAHAPIAEAGRIARKVAKLKTWEREGINGRWLGQTVTLLMKPGGDEVDMGVTAIHLAARAAVRKLSGKDTFGVTMAAACELFSLEEREVVRLCKVLARVQGAGAEPGAWRWKLDEAVATLARQKGRNTAKGREEMG